jgi:hypothetical protein
MILAIDKESKKIIASVRSGGKTENYECIISACENPVCTCGSVDLDLIPIQSEAEEKGRLKPRKVEINVEEKSLISENKKDVPEDDFEFSELFFSNLSEDDFQILQRKHFEFKNDISEKASPDSIDGYFDYHEVEFNRLMYAYNDVLPYGDQLSVAIDGKDCIVFDQYCLLPKCSCTDTNLDVVSIDKKSKTRNELCFISLNYRKKQWKLSEGSSSPVALQTVRAAIEEQLPNIYTQIHKRHIKLKAIYAHCKKKHYSPKEELQLPKVGRNDPCPCGSGKKYKKCCLIKSN